MSYARSIPRDDIPPNFDADSGHILFGLGLACVPLNLIGSFYVILRTYLLWKKSDGHLSMAFRLPFYIAITVWPYTANDIYSASQGHPWYGKPCRVIASVIFYFVTMNILLVGSIAIVTYLRVCKRYPITLGAYDWKLIAFVTILPLVITILSMEDFGPGLYWCYINSQMPPIVPIVDTTMIFGILAVCLFCYICTIREVNRICRNEALCEGQAAHKGRIDEVKVTRKIIAYVLIFICQWVPTIFYNVGEITGHSTLFGWVICTVSVNLGGVGNGIQYAVNEGLWNVHASTFPGASDTQEQAAETERERITSSAFVSIGLVTQYAAGFQVGQETQIEYEYQARAGG